MTRIGRRFSAGCVFSRRHPGGLPLQGPEAGAGEVITASVADDLEHFLA
jgi:hypothetical protein